MIKEFSLYFLSAFFEILGCYSFWSFFKLSKSYIYLSGRDVTNEKALKRKMQEANKELLSLNEELKEKNEKY